MKTPRMGSPADFEWVRFPAADIPGGHCWELPNGEKMFIPSNGSFCIVQYEGDPRPMIKPMRSKKVE